ncbi:MAG: acyltransferase [Isosphaeraceae bacterium]
MTATKSSDTVDAAHETYLSRGHLPELDGLRALAVVLVISFHLKDPLKNWLHGYLGVTVFFVLSGYLITMLALKEERAQGALHLGAFYVRRIFRLMPLYYAVLLAYCVMYFGLGWSSARRPAFLQALPYYLTYLQEFPLFLKFSEQGIPFVHAWSLGIEEKYYLVWPLLAFAVWRGRGVVRRVGTLALGMATGLAPLALGPEIGQFFFPYTHILIGCLTALLLDDPAWFRRLAWLGRPAAGWLVVAGFVAAHLTFPRLEPEGGHLFHALYGVVTAVLLVSLLTGRSVVVERCPPARWSPSASCPTACT